MFVAVFRCIFWRFFFASFALDHSPCARMIWILTTILILLWCKNSSYRYQQWICPCAVRSQRISPLYLDQALSTFHSEWLDECACSTGRWRSWLVSRQTTALPRSIVLLNCVKGEGVQGVLTLFCSGAAQVCHDDRVVGAQGTARGGKGRRWQTRGRGRNRKWRSESRRVRHVENHADGSVNALKTWAMRCVVSSRAVEQRCVCSLSACTPRVR